MEDLIREVMKRTGLSEDQARAAAEVVIAYLGEQLPEPAAGMVAQLASAPEDLAKSERARKVAIATAAVEAAAVNVVVLPGAH